jgi:hypothetical protein
MPNRALKEIDTASRSVASCPDISEMSCSTTAGDIEAVSIPGTPDPFESYFETPNSHTGLQQPRDIIRLTSAPPPVVISLCDELPISNNKKIVHVVSLDDLLRHEVIDTKSSPPRRRRARKIRSSHALLPPPRRYISLDVIIPTNQY